MSTATTVAAVSFIARNDLSQLPVQASLEPGAEDRIDEEIARLEPRELASYLGADRFEGNPSLEQGRDLKRRVPGDLLRRLGQQHARVVAAVV